MELIKTINLRKDYHLGETIVHALRGIDLSIDTGEFVAIWGPSGSGKTTLLNLMGAIDEQTSGQLSIDGKEIRELSDNERTELRNRSVGFIFQGFNLIPVFSALENVMLPLQIKGYNAKKSLDEAAHRLDEVGLSDFIRHRPDKLSGGQQQRVAIARAVVTNPKLILADEPTGNLDSANGAEVMALLTELNEEGTTIVMVTHSPSDAEKAHRIIQLFDGHVVTENIHKKL